MTTRKPQRAEKLIPSSSHLTLTFATLTPVAAHLLDILRRTGAREIDHSRRLGHDDIPVLGGVEGLTEGHGVSATHVVAVLLDLVGVVGDPVEATKNQ